MLQSPLPPGKAFAILNERGQLVQPGQRIHAYACFDQGVAHCLHLDSGRMFSLSQAQTQAIFAPAKPATQKAAPKKAMPTVVYAKLPMTLDNSQTCSWCRTSGRSVFIQVTTADRGMMPVIKCDLCGTLHQPWQGTIRREITSDSYTFPRHELKEKTARPEGEKPTIAAASILPRAISPEQRCFNCKNIRGNTIEMIKTRMEGRKRIIRCAKSTK